MSRETLGLACKAYYNTATYGSPSWSEWSCFRDVQLNFAKGKADFKSRGTGGWAANRGAIKDVDVTAEAVYDSSDAGIQKLQDGFDNGTKIDCLFLDGAVNATGSKGWRIQCECVKLAEKEPMENSKMVDVELCITYDTAHPPARYTVA